MTPAEVITWVGNITLAEISLMTERELLRIGWISSPSDNISIYGLYHIGSTGVWVARPQDTTGRLPIEEKSGQNISNFTLMTRYILRNHTNIPAMSGVGFGVDNTIYSQYGLIADFTLNGSGALSAQDLIAAQGSGHEIWPEELIVWLDSDTADESSIAGNSGIVTIKDGTTGNTLMEGVLSRQTGYLKIKHGDLAGDNEKITIEVAAGTGGNLGASKIYCSLKWRDKS
jgi:hypothetical protein